MGVSPVTNMLMLHDGRDAHPTNPHHNETR